MTSGNAKVKLPLAALVAAALACGGPGGEPAPDATLQGIAVGADRVYASVGVPQQLSAIGRYSDGTTAALAAGLAWTSSDPTVATVDAASGVVTPWAQGTALITVRHEASGLSAVAGVVSRVVVPLAAAAGRDGAVDSTAAFFHVTGLQPGAMYAPSVGRMSDDVDLAVYGDASMEPGTELCASEVIGLGAETCVAPANASGELWIAVDGQWTRAGATFRVEVPGTEPLPIAATLAWPSAFPYAGAIGVAEQMFEVTGLIPGARYEVRITNLTADLDLDVHADPYDYALLCESYASGTVDDACVATADASGRFYVEVDGGTTRGGGSYTLKLTVQ